MTGEVVLEFPAPADPISMNAKDNREFGRAKQAWRDAAYMHWCEAHPGVGPSGRAAPVPAEVHVTIPFQKRRARDPINYARTVKHIVDGLVLAGAWPDDTPDYVTQHIPTLVESHHLPVLVRISPRKDTP
jgi:hypothetical protein